MPTMFQSILQLFMIALHEAPELISDGRNVLHAIANSGPDGLQKVVTVADGLQQLADHAQQAAAQATGNPSTLPASTLPQGEDKENPTGTATVPGSGAA